MTLRPSTIDELRDIVPQHPRLRIRGGGTKPGLSDARGGEEVLDLSALAGVIEHTPEECTFTALAGTRVREIERLLAPHRQYLPFDPPLSERGATIGGTVAAGVSGSCRYRYGGVRDFIIGARIVDGRGRLVRSGGKVVKNAAGFLLHQGMTGSCGQFGVLAEVTFKVFPHASEYATVLARYASVEDALAGVTSLQSGRFDLEAVDIDAGSALVVRLGGAPDVLPERIARLTGVLGADAEVLRGEQDARVWQDAREFRWAPENAALARVPLVPSRIPALERALVGVGARRRYALGGHVAIVAWPGELEGLAAALSALNLPGQILTGACDRATIGAPADSEFARRVRDVMDPDARFAFD